MSEREKELGFLPQRENSYNRFLPKKETLDQDSKVYLEEIKAHLTRAILDNDIKEGAHKWVINLHKYMILYGLKFSKEDHVFFIHVLYGLLTTKHVDTAILDAFAKVLHMLLKKKYLLTRQDLVLEWEPLFQLYWFWEDSSLALRGLLKPAQGFKAQIKTAIKFSRGFFSDDATQQMLNKWRHMLCPHDRSMSTGMKYFCLFLPTSRDVSPAKSWQLWLPEFSMFWATWGNSPAWEVDLLKLYNRLAFHQVGEVDWEPMMGDLYTRFMTSFKLPVTYGNSGVRNKHGLSGNSCLGSITQWIVATLGPGSSGQDHLARLLVALQSYYHPANLNSASEYLHAFVSFLCNQFVNRVHVERHNRKWPCRVAPEKRLRDEDIAAFVTAVKPVAFHVLYSTYEEEARSVFNSLCLLAPEKIIPDLLDRLTTASESLTEPHRFHVCIQALSAAAGPLMRTYPERAIDLLNLLLPGIDVNDIWKCTDIFILMSDLLEMMPVADLTKQQQYRLGNNANLSEIEHERLMKTADLENFVHEFMNRCFTLIENTRRENVRADAGNSDDYLNDEELAADAAVNDTFLRIVANASDEMFTVIFDKLQKYLRGKIVEPNVAGGILASMCKSVVQARPAAGLAFFVPYLSESITRLVREREGRVTLHKTDEELQFNLQLLSEVVSVRNAQLYRSRGSHVVPYIEQICSVLDLTLHLTQKDEYELAHSMLQSLLTWLSHIRLVETAPRQVPALSGWGATLPLANLAIDWYRPADQELGVVRGLMERYMVPLLASLDRYAKGEQEMDKDTLTRNLKLVWRIVVGVSELLPPEQVCEWESVLSKGMSWMDSLQLTLPGGAAGEGEEMPIRQAVGQLLTRVQARILAVANDDTDSLSALLNVQDVLIFCYGMDEEEIGDHIEDHKREKLHREDRLIKNKQHLPSVHYERISIQWETHVWLKNILVLESLPRQTFEDIFSLCVHQYSEVRVLAQEIILKIIARIGRSSHSLILPKLVKCLEHAPGVVSHEMFKAALYIVNSEKFMFFYSWEAAAQLWPPLVSAQHSDKQSLDDLLRDIGIKMNRHFQDFALYTLPLSAPEPPASLLQAVRHYQSTNQSQSPLLQPTNRSLERLSLGPHIHYQALAASIVRLVAAKSLHWRHHEMAVGMLLTMVTYDHTPDRETTSLWLQLLLDDQRTIRMMAYQALEGILKLEKIKSRKVPLETVLVERLGGPPPPPLFPGLREDNEFLQYRSEMEVSELEMYWSQPFLVKSNLGYWGWPAGQKARLPHAQEDFQHPPGSVRDLIAQFFLNESLVTRFVELNSLEHEKGEDFFSMDRGLFLSFLLENIGPALASAFQTHIELLVSSPEESQQRAAAEMVYGLVRGMRFWDFQSALQTWSWLLPVFQQVLTSVTAETQRDWDFCFSGASDKADSNRLRPLYELLVMPENLMSQGAFKESSYLLFVTKCLSQNWRVRDLYCRTYSFLRSHWDHPYNNVRHQIANTLATLLAMDIPLMKGAAASSATTAAVEWNVGRGFPTIKAFVDEILPRLSLNIHNPEFSSSKSSSQEDLAATTTADVVVKVRGGDKDEDNDNSLRHDDGDDDEDEKTASANTSSEDVSMASAMETEGGGSSSGGSDETKRANRTLETVSLWICHQIRLSSATLSTELFRLMPYLCQFTGTERDQDVAQACLQALCYLSMVVLPDKAIPVMLDITKRIAMSHSYKTKMSMLEYVQVAVFTNFPKIVVNAAYRQQIQHLVVSLLKDESLPVRHKSAKILGGLLHSGFLEEAEVTSLLADLRSRVRPKMTRAGKRFRKGTTTTAATAAGAEPVDNSKDQALQHHSGILGLCAFVEAFPYDVPSFVPPILMELSTHLNDPQPIPTTIKKALQEFKRTHQDNWQEHKTKFSEDQLVVMTDLLVSQNYYA